MPRVRAGGVVNHDRILTGGLVIGAEPGWWDAVGVSLIRTAPDRATPPRRPHRRSRDPDRPVMTFRRRDHTWVVGTRALASIFSSRRTGRFRCAHKGVA